MILTISRKLIEIIKILLLKLGTVLSYDTAIYEIITSGSNSYLNYTFFNN